MAYMCQELVWYTTYKIKRDSWPAMDFHIAQYLVGLKRLNWLRSKLLHVNS